MSLIHRSRFSLLASAILCPFVALAQTSASTSPTTAATPVTCAPMANIAVPSRAAILAKVTNFDSGHLKPGKDVWFKLARPFNYPACSLDTDSVVYAHVIAVSSNEVSLSFDRADCNHHDQQPLKLRIIGIVGPPDQLRHMHEDLPSEVAGGARDINQAVYGTSEFDEDLNPGGPPHTIRPGIVVGIKNLKLEPTRGVECSDRISTENNHLVLASGSQLILAMTVNRNIRKPLPSPSSMPHIEPNPIPPAAPPHP
ncbi:MAG: hypothetical protein JST28_12900 [Acidobacteria bacterium]|nr:hypothetical protein [Acidobacteriota bacterium]